MDAVRTKLTEIENRYNAISDEMLKEEVYSNPSKLTRLSREQASLKQAVDAWVQLRSLDERIEQADEMLHENDEELKEMARMEKEECEPERDRLLEHIQHLLIPRDPDDDHDAIMEIRGGAGGDEGNIFAGDLYRMYTKYAESKGWKVQVLEASVSEAGGFSQIIYSVKGTDVYRELKYESGVHRVQRVPKTEAQGRIHTSTATVLCQPEAEEEDIEIDPKDLTIETHRASGAGGQHINKTDSAVRIVHLPTGITVNCQEGRSQIENRETAMRLIRARVYEELRRQKEEEEGKIRRAKIGTGDRSEKIRTYNYPQNRVTDHRIGLTITQLDRIMEGKLDGIIEGLLAEEEKRKLEENAQ
ncbi:MAG: peptide chain release factor 1 [Erysipelotrichaceae bacterium]|jgi:peptide chain release factor 1|nr:peptide chain release factor 1 [Erysipelotrichaceae bacterium]